MLLLPAHNRLSLRRGPCGRDGAVVVVAHNFFLERVLDWALLYDGLTAPRATMFALAVVSGTKFVRSIEHVRAGSRPACVGSNILLGGSAVEHDRVT